MTLESELKSSNDKLAVMETEKSSALQTLQAERDSASSSTQQIEQLREVSPLFKTYLYNVQPGPLAILCSNLYLRNIGHSGYQSVTTQTDSNQC